MKKSGNIDGKLAKAMMAFSKLPAAKLRSMGLARADINAALANGLRAILMKGVRGDAERQGVTVLEYLRAVRDLYPESKN